MASDSLDYVSYFRIALWLTGRLDSTLVRLQKHTLEPSFYPEDMMLPKEQQELLWNAFYANSKESGRCD